GRSEWLGANANIRRAAIGDLRVPILKVLRERSIGAPVFVDCLYAGVEVVTDGLLRDAAASSDFVVGRQSTISTSATVQPVGSILGSSEEMISSHPRYFVALVRVSTSRSGEDSGTKWHKRWHTPLA